MDSVGWSCCGRDQARIFAGGSAGASPAFCHSSSPISTAVTRLNAQSPDVDTVPISRSVFIAR